MDWYVPNSAAAASQLRDEFGAYLRRHADPESDFMAAELVFSELVTNAVENSTEPVWVSLNWATRQPVLTVHDLGAGFSMPDDDTMPGPEEDRGRGLLIVTHLIDELRLASKAAGGTRARVTLPVQRPPSPSIDHDPSPVGHLLTDADAGELGNFGREAFLRALVVQMAQTVEFDAGPLTAETAIASVGASIGQRMEESFRDVRDGDDGPLDVSTIAELFVGLKRAIDGDFFVIEATEQRIVLGNRRCPFGDAVRRAPSLCRMTSSVFGGIAARNADGAAVHLEERIAVGDPECRVTVWLEEPPRDIEPEIHFYGRMRPTDD